MEKKKRKESSLGACKEGNDVVSVSLRRTLCHAFGNFIRFLTIPSLLTSLPSIFLFSTLLPLSYCSGNRLTYNY